MSEKSHHNLQNWILLVLLTLIWGTSYILIKKGLLGFSPVEIGCLRISISCICCLPLVVKAFQKIPRNKYATILLMGLFSSGFPAFLFPLSMTKSESSVNGIINSLSPLWTILIGYYIFKVSVSRQKLLGVLIGFSGALVLVLGKRNADFKIDVWYSLLPVLATLCYGIGTNLTKQKLPDENPIYTTALAMFMMGVPALIGLFFTAAPAKIASGQAWIPLICIATLAIFSTVIAWMLFYRLLQRTDAVFAASVTFLVPIVAISWGILDGEVLSLLQFGGMGLILTGVYFTTKSRQG